MSAPAGAFAYDRHPCGCESWCQVRLGVRELVVRPCRPGCALVATAVADTRAAGKLVKHRPDTRAAGPRGPLRRPRL